MAACHVVAHLGLFRAGLQRAEIAEVGKQRLEQHCVGNVRDGSSGSVMLHCCKSQRRRVVSGGLKSSIGRPAFRGRVNGRDQRRVVKCMAEAENEVGEKPTKSSSQLEQLEQLGFGSKGSGKKGKSTTVRRPAPERPVIAPSSTEPSQEQVYEQYYVVSLAIVFGFIIVMGIALAASGFFPEDIDDLVLKYVYPSFSPTIGVFLLGSSLYGVYKYLGGAKPNS